MKDSQIDDEFSSSPEGEPSTSGISGLGRTVWRLFREMLETVVPAILIALLINVFVGQATRVEGKSMEPTLHSNQRLVVEKVSYRLHGPNRFDVVVLKMPSQGGELLIKRVVGLPGETVEFQGGQVLINGTPLDEPFVGGDTSSGRTGVVTVPPLHVFVLGDNRDHSNDSRAFGPVPIEHIVGRAWLSYWPPEDAGLVH
jgi:signal peptidase I